MTNTVITSVMDSGERLAEELVSVDIDIDGSDGEHYAILVDDVRIPLANDDLNAVESAIRRCIVAAFERGREIGRAER